MSVVTVRVTCPKCRTEYADQYMPALAMPEETDLTHEYADDCVVTSCPSCDHLVSVVNHLFGHQGSIRTHAYNILVVIIICNAVDIHRKGEGLVLGNGRYGGKLYALHPEAGSLDPWTGFAVFCLYAVAGLIAAAFVLHRRDA